MTATDQNKGMKTDALKGFVGISGVTMGGIISLQNLETWLRIASLIVGLAVGIASFWSIVRKSRKK